MRKCLLLIAILIIYVQLVGSLSSTAAAHELPSKITAKLKQLDKSSGGSLEIYWNNLTNTPAKLTGRLSQPSKHTPEWIAYGFLSKWRVLYGLKNPNSAMMVIKVERYSDSSYVYFQHLLFQTPVWEDGLVVEISHEGVIERVEGTIHPHLEKQLFNKPMHPGITKKQAIKKAIARMQEFPIMEPSLESYYLSSRSGTPLIYVIKLYYSNPNREITTFVHALTGRIIELDS